MCDRSECLEVVDIFNLCESFCHDSCAMFFEISIGVELVLVHPFGFHNRGAWGNGADVEYLPAVKVAEIEHFEVLGGDPFGSVRCFHCFFVCHRLAIELLDTGRCICVSGVESEDEGGVESCLAV